MSFSATCQDDHFYLSLSGLDASFEAGVALMEHLLADALPNPEALQNLVADILQRRENDKTDKRIVLTKAMANYAKHGKKSPFSDKLTKEELLAVAPEELIALLHRLTSYQHEIFYYGQENVRSVAVF